MHKLVHADHVGSLLRPARLLAARHAAQRGQLSAAKLREQEDTLIPPVLRRLQDMGLPVTDGEYRRRLSLDHFLALFDPAAYAFTQPLPWHDRWGNPAPPDLLRLKAPLVGRPLVPSGLHLLDHEVQFLLDHTPAQVTKTTIPSAGHFAVWSWAQPTSTVYPSREDLLTAATNVLVTEARAVTAAGVGYLQVDNPVIHHLGDQTIRTGLALRGANTDQLLTHIINADNRIFDTARATNPGVATGLHICRGTAGPYRLSDGGYHPIAERLFTHTHADRILLEYAADMPDPFAILRHAHPDTLVLLGLVSTRGPQLEDPDDLRRALDAAAKHLPRGLDQLGLTTQCGFASIAWNQPMTDDLQWAKLQLIADVATTLWGT